MATIAELYCVARTGKVTKPCSWVAGQPDISADAIDITYLARAHYHPDGRNVTFCDGSTAEKILSRYTPWKPLQ